MPRFELEVDLKRNFTFDAETEREALEMLEDSGECECINPEEDFGYEVVGIIADGVRTKPIP